MPFTGLYAGNVEIGGSYNLSGRWYLGAATSFQRAKIYYEFIENNRRARLKFFERAWFLDLLLRWRFLSTKHLDAALGVGYGFAYNSCADIEIRLRRGVVEKEDFRNRRALSRYAFLSGEVIRPLFKKLSCFGRFSLRIPEGEHPEPIHHVIQRVDIFGTITSSSTYYLTPVVSFGLGIFYQLGN
ncbi:MAG: hypothetical protein NZM43_03205 [Saprospiraceae bacterium]|nr:hypothetical protein [Saprospiraceae bacterium]MDW8483311.1 hypothetical protein [Saprospiraceae bacterium]